MYKYFINHNLGDTNPHHWWNWRFKLSHGSLGFKDWAIELNSWSGFRFSLGVSSGINDNMWVLDLGLIFFTLYFKFRHPLLPQAINVIKDYEDREFKLAINNWMIRLEAWEKEHHWSSTDKRRWKFDIQKFFLGKRQYETKDVHIEDMVVTFPEGEYKVNFRFFVSHWWWDRWPFKEKLLRCDMSCKEGIPVPGKGENSWDCGDDKTFGLTCPVKTIDVKQAAWELIQSVYETRTKYGSGPDMYKEKAC